MIILPRRGFLAGLAALITAPAIVPIQNLMKLPPKTFRFIAPWVELLSGGKVVGVRATLPNKPTMCTPLGMEECVSFPPAEGCYVVDAIRVADAFGNTMVLELVKPRTLLTGDTIIITSPKITLA